MPANGDGMAAGEDALLDRFVEAALAETVAVRADEPAPTIAVADEVETVLQRAAALLRSRPDREQLIERLRASIAPAEEKPGPSAPPDSADGTPE
jgi:hypothetical protein